MKGLLKITLIATSLALSLTACSEKSKDAEPGSDNRIQVSAQMKSSELTDAAEQLVSPYTFMLADKVLDQALEKDSGNIKAQFYKNFLKRAMAMKGIAKRIAPLQKSAKQKADYDKWMTEFPESPLKSFLLDGKEDIHTYSQFADLIADYNRGLNEFRKFLKVNQNAELTLNLNPYVFEKEINQELVNSCTWTGENGNYDIHCSYMNVAQKKLNVADMIALRQMTSGEMLYWSFYTAYDASVVEKAFENDQMKNKSQKEILAYFQAQPSVGQLRKDHTLNLIPEIGSDFSAAAKWALQYQDRVCPKGSGSLNQRKGYLFKNGICADHGSADSTDKALSLIDQAMAGVFSVEIKKQGQTVDQIQMNLVQFVTAPPSDLKNIMPSQVDDYGVVTDWTDSKMGGLFPNGDISKLKQAK